MHQGHKHYLNGTNLSLDSAILINTIYSLSLVLVTRNKGHVYIEGKRTGLKQIIINHRGKKQPLKSPLTS